MPKKPSKTTKNCCVSKSCCASGVEEKPIGKVTHYFSGINVGIIKFNRTVNVGETLKFKGTTTDFEQIIESMQFDHKDIKSAKKNQEVGIKVKEKVREGDEVYAAA